MSYKYGASFNCIVTKNGTRCKVGGGNEDRASLDYVSNDLQVLGDFLEARDNKYIVSVDHEHVGGVCELGNGRIVAVLGELGDYQGESYLAVVAVIFEDPETPVVIEIPKLSHEEVIEKFFGDATEFDELMGDNMRWLEIADTGSATLELSDDEGKEYEVVVSLHFDIKEKTNVIA